MGNEKIPFIHLNERQSNGGIFSLAQIATFGWQLSQSLVSKYIRTPVRKYENKNLHILKMATIFLSHPHFENI